jgi:MFS family permease
MPLSANQFRLPFFYGWVVVGIAFVTMAISVNTRSAFSLLFPPILAEMGWDRGTTAAAFSIGFLASALFAPAVGIGMDRWGPRLVISCAAVLVGSGLALTPFITSAWELYLTYGVMVVGASVSMSYMGHGAFLPNWFVRRRGLALGIAFSGVGFGAIVLLPWLQTLIDGPGWRTACWALAAILVIVVVPLNLVGQRAHPRELGLEPDGGSADDTAARETTSIVDADWANTDWTVARAIRTKRFWWMFAAISFALFAWYAIQVHQTRFLLDVGYDSELAALALGAVPFCGLVGQIAIGHFSDRVGREWGWTVCCIGFFVCYAACLAISYTPSTWLLYLMIGAQGMMGYGLPILVSAIPAELFAGPRFASIFGALSISAAVGPSSGPWLMGSLFDHYGNYQAAFIVGMAVCVISIGCVWMAAPRKVRTVAGRTRA